MRCYLLIVLICIPLMINDHFMANRWETMETVTNFIFFWGGGGTPKSLQMVIAAMKLKDACSLEEKL